MCSISSATRDPKPLCATLVTDAIHAVKADNVAASLGRTIRPNTTVLHCYTRCGISEGRTTWPLTR
jgi:hypothetical protein